MSDLPYEHHKLIEFKERLDKGEELDRRQLFRLYQSIMNRTNNYKDKLKDLLLLETLIKQTKKKQ